MSSVPFIGHPSGLAPKVRQFGGEDCVNADGIIEIARLIDTPQAKALYRFIRKRLVEVEASEPTLAPEKQRQKAVLAAIQDAGWNPTFTPAGGAA